MNTDALKELKAELHTTCVKLLDERIEAIREITEVAEGSTLDDTKSSAGDKYETGREMLKQEMEKNAMQLDEALRQKQILLSLAVLKHEEGASAGSLVVTDKMNFYITVGLGQVKCAQQSFMVVSPLSPIGKMLAGKKVGEKFSFNAVDYQIRNIL